MAQDEFEIFLDVHAIVDEAVQKLKIVTDRVGT